MSNVIEMPHVALAKETYERYVLEMADLYVGTCKIFGKEKNPSYHDYIEISEDGKHSSLKKKDIEDNNVFLCMVTLEMADLICYRCLGDSPISEDEANDNEGDKYVH
jgi:hypothetical protein